MRGMADKKTRAASVVLLGLVVAEAVSAFETTMAYQLLYAQDPFFGTDITKLSWIVTSYLLVAAAAAGVCGRLGDQFGRRKVTIIVLLISAIGSIVSALAPSVEVVIAGRALQGISGCILPLAIGIAREALPPRMVTLGISLIGTTALLAGSAGSIVGGIVLDFSTWPVIFYIGAALAAIACMVCVFAFPADTPGALAGGKVDYLGASLFAIGIAVVLYGISNSGKWGFGDVRTMAFLGGGLLTLAIWATWELRVTNPMIDLRRFRNPKFSLTMLATAACAFGLFGFSAVLPVAIMRTPQALPTPEGGTIDLPVGLGLSATEAGLYGSIAALVGFACSPLVARISRKLGAARTVMIGCAIGIGAYLSLIVTHQALLPFVISLVALGAFGTGFAYAGLPTLLAECVPAAETSAATGIQAVVRTAFQGTASAVIGVLLALNAVQVGQASFVSETGVNTTVFLGILAVAVALVLAYAASRFKGSMLDHSEKQTRDAHRDRPAANAGPVGLTAE